MSIRNLQYLFNPQSVAVIGASSKEHSVGSTVLNNLIEAGFAGAIWPVNPKYDTLAGHTVYASAAHLPHAPDLAVICTPAHTIPTIIAQLGARGTKAAVVLTAGLGVRQQGHDKSIGQAMQDAAKPTLLRILGPNCVGLLVPGIGLNASFAHTGALQGKLAFASQSGALVTGVLDWAKSRNIGFSKFISMGESADVDFGDVLDYLASDADTEAILLYIEDVRGARKFMSAARAAARNKPVLVIKAGRAAEGAKAAASHTGALAGLDAVYDAAIRRAGMLRVFSTEDLFSAVETLAHAHPLRGERLTIMTNGGGPGVMATDALISLQGCMASLSPDAVQQLDAILPSTWSGANPVDIIGDAPIERYLATLEVLLQNPQSDAVLFIHAPTAIVPSAAIATALAPLAAANRVIACWLGGAAVAEARHIFSSAGIPTYDTPEEAVHGFMQMVQFRRNQNLLMEVPPSVAGEFTLDRAAAQAIVQRALATGNAILSEPDTKQILAAYDIPVVATRCAATVDAAILCAQEIGFPVALKILSPDISHKSDVGGVVLDLETPQALRAAAKAMHQRLQQLNPDARLEGFSVQAMARWPGAQELIIGVTTDPVFGPVILFGQGGVAVEVTDDRALGLPPLNMVLANDMISRTRVSKLLAGYRNQRAADLDAICHTLIKISQLVTDLPEVMELDINPLLADSRGVIALDARMRIAKAANAGLDRLAIRPYPQQWEQWVTWQDAALLLRPIKPEDGAQHRAFFAALDPEDVRYRMFIRQNQLPPSQLARLTQIDYDREIAFIATRQVDGHASGAEAKWETLGVARAIADPDNMTAEFAIIVRSDLKSHGLGRMLMTRLIDYCRQRGTAQITGQALSHNLRVLNLVRSLGFTVNSDDAEPGTMQLRLDLTSDKTPAHKAP
jgi:acetyltransferase